MSEFFYIRHDIFVYEKKWRDPHPSGKEIDQFDRPDTTYLIGVDDIGIVFGARLLPNGGSTMMRDVFPQFDISPVQTDDVAEWSRGFIAPRARTRTIGSLQKLYVATVMAYCAREGLRYAGGIQDATWRHLWQRLKWPCIQMGQSVRIDGRMCMVLYMEVSMDAIKRALPEGYTLENILVHEGPYRSFLSFGAEANAQLAG